MNRLVTLFIGLVLLWALTAYKMCPMAKRSGISLFSFKRESNILPEFCRTQ